MGRVVDLGERVLGVGVLVDLECGVGLCGIVLGLGLLLLCFVGMEGS